MRTEGSDATAHMSEETGRASTIIPKAMVGSYVINGLLTLVMIITYCFLLVDYTSAEKSATGLLGLPFLQVFANATGSIRGGAALSSILVVLQIFGTMNFMAACARQIFAFARDKGLPFGYWIAKVDAAGTYPVNAVLVVWGFVMLLSLITLGSYTAFEAITSLTMLALTSTYLISLGCVLWRRCFGGGLPASPWTLGRFGIPINVLALCYCIFLIIFLPWPVTVPVTKDNFNWASVMFIGILVLSAFYYIIRARKAYMGPVVQVRPRGE